MTIDRENLIFFLLGALAVSAPIAGYYLDEISYDCDLCPENITKCCNEKFGKGNYDTWNAMAIAHGGLHCEGPNGHIIHGHGRHNLYTMLGIMFFVTVTIVVYFPLFADMDDSK